MKFVFDKSFFKRSMFTDTAGSPQVPVDNPLHTNPQVAARSVGSKVIPNVVATMNGSNLMLETKTGHVTIALTPEQINQLKTEFPDLG